jgi:hypothetical protein
MVGLFLLHKLDRYVRLLVDTEALHHPDFLVPLSVLLLCRWTTLRHHGV